MNCTIKEYTLFDGDVRTETKFRVLYRNRQVVKAEGEFTGEMSNWAMTREKWGRGETNIPGMERERRESIKMAQFFGLDTPPKKVQTVTETIENEDGTQTVVTKPKPKGKKGRTSIYSESDMKALGEAIAASGLDLAGYLLKEGREAEKTALYARLKNLGIEFKSGKRGRKKGTKLKAKAVEIVQPTQLAA